MMIKNPTEFVCRFEVSLFYFFNNILSLLYYRQLVSKHLSVELGSFHLISEYRNKK